MSAQQLLREGQLAEATAAILGEVRDNPQDVRRRTFLFELLCFAGEYERALKHLALLGDTSAEAGVGALLYRSAIAASRKRDLLYESGDQPAPSESVSSAGTLNGLRFETIEDCDPRIGGRLEVFIAGELVLLPFAHVGTLTMREPKLLRDTLWPTAYVTAGPAIKESQDFGEVLLPVLYPDSWSHADPSVKLGRETVSDDSQNRLLGQKLLLLDGERVVPYLEIRELLFEDAGREPQASLEALPTGPAD